MKPSPPGAEEAEQAKLEFIDFVAHELVQPITSIQGYAKMMLMGIAGELTETQEQFAQHIKSNAERMGKLVNDLLEISRLEAGRIKLSLFPVHLDEAVDKALAAIHPEIEERRHTLELDIPEGLPPALGERERLVQVLTLLVTNACRYTPEGGTIRIVLARCSGPFLKVSLSDTGIGISASDLDHLEAGFFRANHELVQAHPGFGLGVSIARLLIQLHGGELTIESHPGQGSTFSFTVPTAGAAEG